MELLQKLAESANVRTRNGAALETVTVGDFRKGSEFTAAPEIGWSKNGTAYLLFLNADKTKSKGPVYFSQPASAALKAGEIKLSHINALPMGIVPITNKETGEVTEQERIMLPQGAKRLSLEGVKDEAFQRTFSVSQVVAAAGATSLVG